MRFAVLSDTHYISLSTLYSEAETRDVLRHDINVSLFKKLTEQTGIDTVLITGDLCDAGDMQSHLEFVEILKQLQDSGKRVFVLTATHDFHFSRAWVSTYGWPVRYRARPWERPWCDLDKVDYRALALDEYKDLPDEKLKMRALPVATPDDLWELYRPFGRDQAFSTCDSAYSYAVKLEDKLWCLMLNNNFRDIDANYDMSPTYSPACLRWIRSVLDDAEKEGAFVFACTHHPLVPPVPAYRIGGTTRNMRSPTVVHTLADVGLQLVFSGHTHFADVAFGASEAGNVLCNVTTPSVCYLPPAWRIADLRPEEHRLILATVPVENDPSFGIAAPTLKEHFRTEFIEEYRRKIGALPHGLGKIVLGLKARHLRFLCPRALDAAGWARIADESVFGLLMEAVVNMQCGDGRFTPDTPEYGFLMGLAAALDSLIDAQPFVDVRKKLLGYSVCEIVEPMLFNNYVPDNDADFVFDTLPAPNVRTAPPRSLLGEAVMGVLCVLAAALSPASPVLAAAALPALTLLKKRSLKKDPPKPERY